MGVGLVKLRSYQQQLVDGMMREYAAGRRRTAAVMATGGGKTPTGMTVANMSLAAGHPVLWVAHRTELIDQAIDKARQVARGRRLAVPARHAGRLARAARAAPHDRPQRGGAGPRATERMEGEYAVRYSGGKSRSAARIAEVIRSLSDPRRWGLLSPFCGGLAVELRLVDTYQFMLLSDLSPDLIAMWEALNCGWRPPPALTEAEYLSLRDCPPSALRGFAGFGASFGGKWFGGYGRTSQPERNGGAKTVAEQSARTVARDAEVLSRTDARFMCLDYRDVHLKVLDPNRVVIYADPPYLGTLGYAATGEFNSLEFWNKADEWVEMGFQVFVSEERAPGHWDKIWTANVPASMARSKSIRTEALFTR